VSYLSFSGEVINGLDALYCAWAFDGRCMCTAGTTRELHHHHCRRRRQHQHQHQHYHHPPTTVTTTTATATTPPATTADNNNYRHHPATTITTTTGHLPFGVVVSLRNSPIKNRVDAAMDQSELIASLKVRACVHLRACV
jgi:hypothetical protein